ncbi:MAG: RNB domain-containing ribonuclease, partial [Bacteroidales bacterium]|nr:RNB domain-containing ribonuclease [Bacteroidales bacterium]
INSDKRLSYQQAQETIDSGEGDMKEELLELNKLAQILRERRFKSGAISFDKTEVKFDLDDKGKPLAIHFCEHGTANELVEEFMLLANRKVAEYVGKELKKKPFVYRIHDKPDPEKITKFSEFVTRFGLKLQVGEKGPLPKSLNKILHAVQGKKEQNIVENLAMRSMAKAVYSTDNIGHYGLAFKYYTHFTSPIRRYPDMMVHRLLASYLKKEAPDNLKYEQLCDHSSNMERIATEAERASIKYKQVEFMSENIGKTFDGIISGVTEWGIYVELTENLCEGMIHIRNLDDDFYSYDEDNYQIVGRSTGKTYTLGDKISIEVMKADLEKKQLDFKLASNPNKK